MEPCYVPGFMPGPLPTLTLILQGRLHILTPNLQVRKTGRLGTDESSLGESARPELEATNKWPNNNNS